MHEAVGDALAPFGVRLDAMPMKPRRMDETLLAAPEGWPEDISFRLEEGLHLRDGARRSRTGRRWPPDRVSAGDRALGGPAVAVPSGGFVRIYTFVGGLPGIPGHLYPASRALCPYWQEPVPNCVLLRAAGTKLLSAFAHLPLRSQTPTTPVAIRYGSRLLRYANGNLFSAVELA